MEEEAEGERGDNYHYNVNIIQKVNFNLQYRHLSNNAAAAAAANPAKKKHQQEEGGVTIVTIIMEEEEVHFKELVI
jgi:hypothetical protein